MNRLAIFGALTVLSSSALGAQSAPEPPPGSGTAEQTFRRAIEREGPLLHDAWFVRLCGLRSVAWFDNLSEAMQIVISEVHTELHSKAPNPAQFEAYANTLMKWLYWQQQPTVPTTRENCEAALDTVNQFDCCD